MGPVATNVNIKDRIETEFLLSSLTSRILSIFTRLFIPKQMVQQKVNLAQTSDNKLHGKKKRNKRKVKIRVY